MTSKSNFGSTQSNWLAVAIFWIVVATTMALAIGFAVFDEKSVINTLTRYKSEYAYQASAVSLVKSIKRILPDIYLQHEKELNDSEMFCRIAVDTYNSQTWRVSVKALEVNGLPALLTYEECTI